MKRWVKTIIGIVLIIAALIAMYYWNKQGRMRIKEAEEAALLAQEIESKADPKADMLKIGKSYFPIPIEWIAAKSAKLEVGDYVGIYYKTDVKDETQVDSAGNKIQKSDQTEINKHGDTYGSDTDMNDYPGYAAYDTVKFGKFEVAYIDDVSVEIVCRIADYARLENMLAGEQDKIIMVMEAKDE